MLRRLLTLLAALPLLLPPGVCPCRLVTVCDACTQQGVASEEAATACTCCEAEAAEPVADVVLTDAPCCPPLPVNQNRDDHHPACPSQGSAQWKADLTPVAASLLLDCVALATDLPTVPTSAELAPSDFSPPSDRPIYLTLLTLRI
jgi:hypothetical protein